MSLSLTLSFCVLALLTLATAAVPRYNPKPFDAVLNRRQASSNDGSSSSLVIDLGYERYRGVFNKSTGLNNWFGYLFKTRIVSVNTLTDSTVSAMQPL